VPLFRSVRFCRRCTATSRGCARMDRYGMRPTGTVGTVWAQCSLERPSGLPAAIPTLARLFGHVVAEHADARAALAAAAASVASAIADICTVTVLTLVGLVRRRRTHLLVFAWGRVLLVRRGRRRPVWAHAHVAEHPMGTARMDRRFAIIFVSQVGLARVAELSSRASAHTGAHARPAAAACAQAQQEMQPIVEPTSVQRFMHGLRCGAD
jgi:hypothetical protein